MPCLSWDGMDVSVSASRPDGASGTGTTCRPFPFSYLFVSPHLPLQTLTHLSPQPRTQRHHLRRRRPSEWEGRDDAAGYVCVSCSFLAWDERLDWDVLVSVGADLGRGTTQPRLGSRRSRSRTGTGVCASVCGRPRNGCVLGVCVVGSP